MPPRITPSPDALQLPLLDGTSEEVWRRGRDSNPRYPFRYAGFQDRSHQPLGHLSDYHSFTTVHGSRTALAYLNPFEFNCVTREHQSPHKTNRFNHSRISP